MALLRRAILWASQNPSLKKRVPRYRFVRRAVRRFMPGESLDDALAVAKSFAQQGLPTTLTHLGENVTSPEEATAITDHYLEVFDRVAELGLDTEVSIKLTHLGLDFDPELAYRKSEQLAERARDRGNWLWIDIESHPYVDPTVANYQRLRTEFEQVGLCLQAYLRRTPSDIEQLRGLRSSIRLVKGAYREPAEITVGKKRDIDDAFVRLSLEILSGDPPPLRLAVATHDLKLIRRIQDAAGKAGVSRDRYEVQMLYGIRQAEQFALLKEGLRVRTLIAYGSSWYPWYMRRLAERPANLLFVIRNMLQRTRPG